MLKKVDITFTALLLLAAASVIVSSITLSVALVCFSALRGYMLWSMNNKPADINEALKQELQEVRSFIAASSIKQAANSKPLDGRRLF